MGLTSFVLLFIDDNDLKGSIPSAIGILTGLTYLSLGELLCSFFCMLLSKSLLIESPCL